MPSTTVFVFEGGELAKKFEKFDAIREKCRKRTAKQVERMLERFKKGRVELTPGTSVRIPIPLIDRAKSDNTHTFVLSLFVYYIEDIIVIIIYEYFQY